MINIILTAVVLLLLVPVVFWGVKKDKETFFSKDYTTVLKGLCAIIIIFVHIPVEHGNVLQDAVGSFAYVCVTAFFMVSSYGMLYSAERKKNYIKSFWRNRLVALLIPVLVINLVNVLVGLVMQPASSFSVAIHDSLLRLFQINYYVIVLLEYCLIFYLVTLLKRKYNFSNLITDSILIIVVTVSSLYLYLFKYDVISADAGWCFERMGLVWGILLYRFFTPLKNWLLKRNFAKLACFTLVALVLGVLYLKFKYVPFWGAYLLKIALGVGILLFVFLASVKFKFKNKVSIFLGNISYEVYLLHGFVMGYLALAFPTMDSGMFVLLTVCITIAVAAVLNQINNRWVKALRK